MDVLDTVTRLVRHDAEQTAGRLVNTGLNAFLGNTNPTPDALDGIQSRGDALQSWCWYCLLPTIGQSPIDGQGQPLTLGWQYVVSFGGPVCREITFDQKVRSGRTAHYPSSFSVPDLTIGFFHDSLGLAASYLQQWAANIVGGDPNDLSSVGSWCVPAQYKKPIKLFCYDVTKTTIFEVEYVNCCPANPGGLLSLNYSEAQGITTDVTFKAEDVKTSITPASSGSFKFGLLDELVGVAKGQLGVNLSGSLGRQLSNGINNSVGTALNRVVRNWL